MAVHFQSDISIVLAGEAGQGIQSIEGMLTRFLKRERYHLFSTKEFMSRVRGGINSTEIRIADKPVYSFTSRIDILVALDPLAIPHLQKRIGPKTVILGDQGLISHPRLRNIPFSKLAEQAGGSLYANTVAVGLLCGFLKTDPVRLGEFVTEYFSGKSEDVRENNRKAVGLGYQSSGERFPDIHIDVKRDEKLSCKILLSGSDAVALGALSGGCDYVCAYPMSPSTGVLAAMAEHSKKFDVIVEQVEDEIGVVNMALGAWYAGARALVTTSGGGFVLMGEGFSLAGMIDSPLVIHVAQRPGPATGLPTRTEQGDLNLALYTGHGEFPRAVYAPGSLEQAFRLTRKAFETADRYQVPTVVLTDQYLVDSSASVPCFELSAGQPAKNVVETPSDYQRFRLTKDGISPRGIPGYGQGFIRADSDEHDEDGFITEDPDVRKGMVQKRLTKMKSLEKSSVPPEFIGPTKYRTLVVGWGSTYHAVREALDRLQRRDTAFLHFSQVFPLSPKSRNYFNKAKRVIVVENNATGQLADLLTLKLGVRIDEHVLKYDGWPFSVEEIERVLRRMIQPAARRNRRRT